MADSQVPWGVDALGGAISEPAWRSKPSWYLVATEDRMIPPPAQRKMSAGRVRPSSRPPAAMRSTSRTPKPSPNSSSRPLPQRARSRTKRPTGPRDCRWRPAVAHAATPGIGRRRAPPRAWGEWGRSQRDRSSALHVRPVSAREGSQGRVVRHGPWTPRSGPDQHADHGGVDEAHAAYAERGHATAPARSVKQEPAGSSRWRHLPWSRNRSCMSSRRGR